MKPCELFASRETIEEAYAFSESLIESFPQTHKAAAYTALWVTLNTCLRQLEKSDLTQLQRGEGPHDIRSVGELTPHEALQRLRNELPEYAAVAWFCERVGDEHTGVLLGKFSATLAKAFGISVDQLATESLPYVKKLIGQTEA